MTDATGWHVMREHIREATPRQRERKPLGMVALEFLAILIPACVLAYSLWEMLGNA